MKPDHVKPFILASQSPRRKELLQMLGWPFEQDIPHFAEYTQADYADASELAFQNAKGKAEEIAARQQNALILGVDTVVSLDHHIFGKPQDPEEARSMLTALSGKTHEVWTALYLLDTATRAVQSCREKTQVTFAPLTPQDIEAYVQTGEGVDKAGAYAIQGKGALFISGIHGDFFNVMGLPLYQLQILLKAINVDVS